MITCPCAASGFFSRRNLAVHIKDRHGVASDPRALLLADRILEGKLAPEDYAVFGVEPRRSTPAAAAAPPAPPEPILAPPAPPQPPPADARVAQPPERRGATPEAAGASPAPRSTPTTPAPEETPMPDDKISKPIPCTQCRKPFVRTHGRQRICPDCKRAVKTGKPARSPRGESPAQAKKWAERVTSAKKPTGGGTRRSKKPKPAKVAAVREALAAAAPSASNGTRTKAEALLMDLRQLRTQLDVKIGHVEELVAIL